MLNSLQNWTVELYQSESIDILFNDHFDLRLIATTLMNF